MALASYTVSIYKSLTGRFCIRHPGDMSHRKHFASLAYTRKFCKKHGWSVGSENV